MGVTEGVYPDGCFGPLVYHVAPLALKFLSGYVIGGHSLREGAGSGELFQEICNIVSVQIKGYFGILMGQVVVCAG